MEEEEQQQLIQWFLVNHYPNQLSTILLSPDLRLHYPLLVDFAELVESHPNLADSLFRQPTEYLIKFDKGAQRAQSHILHKEFKCQKDLRVKEYVHVRINICGSPLEFPETFPSIGRVRVKHRGILLTLKGTVIRSGAIKMVEGDREYQCRKCKHRFKVSPELETGNSVPKPTSCPSQHKFCESTSFQLVEENKVCHDYQEIKVQESTYVLDVGAIPRSIPVILKDDLVDIVKAGGNTSVKAIVI